jgi:hypothetical protein
MSFGADATVHLRIVTVGLIASILVVIIGIAARANAGQLPVPEPRSDRPSTEEIRPPVPAPKGKVVLV